MSEPITVALCGNPNVGKSTVFNALTGLKQHTGNWTGKTVETAEGFFRYRNAEYRLVDLPGTYSLLSGSPEEEVACDFLCFEQVDVAVVVCDAVCLERNLNLALQVMEATPRVVICLNLMDEAAQKGICLDLERLQQLLGVPVVGTSARNGKGLSQLTERIVQVHESADICRAQRRIHYPPILQEALTPLEALLSGHFSHSVAMTALRLVMPGRHCLRALEARGLSADANLLQAVTTARAQLTSAGLSLDEIAPSLVLQSYNAASELCRQATIRCVNQAAVQRQTKLDRLLTSKALGIPVMLCLLALVFFITLTGANRPSAWLTSGFAHLEPKLWELLNGAGAPVWLSGVLMDGVYRVLTWVISVMLPPMAIFFPLFTLLEDLGYLPRVAFNLDHCFQRCCACGKQALCVCMGLGCNAVGVTGCRIIDSPRERLIAILTNSFIPCNGRFPTLLTLLSLFMVAAQGTEQTFLCAVLLVCVIMLSLAMTFLCSRVLSKTVLKGVPSSFTLELPPFRRPQVGKVIVRSILDRTLFVLGRAVVVAAPAGLVIWILANVSADGQTLLQSFANALEPLGKLMGLDGVILLGFILGFPANEIVLPIILMAYLSSGTLVEPGSLSGLKTLLVEQGWTVWTAAGVMVFSLFHWPCSTTLLTIHKETGSIRWTLAAAALPTAVGFLCCVAINLLHVLVGG